MRRILLTLLAVTAALGLGTLAPTPAQAAAHSGETCQNWYPSASYRMGVCVSVHHSAGLATAHVRTHTYKKVGGSWVDMRADSQTINNWTITTNTGFRVNLVPQSVGGQIVYTFHGTANVSLACPPNEPRSANATVNDVSFRTDSGIPFGPVYLDVQSGYSARPC